MVNLDEIAMRSVRKLADLLGSHDRRLARLETAQDARRTSLDDGEVIELRGQSGKVVGTFGKNPDGTYATVPFDGPAPRRLIEPTVDSEGAVSAGEVDVVSDAPGTITVKFSPKQALPSDFAGVDFFYTSGEDRVLLGSVTSLAGGAKTVAVKPGTYEVVAQMRSIPGKTTLLDHRFPVTVAAPVDVKEFDNAKAKLTAAQSQIDSLLAAPPSAGVSVSDTPPSDPKDGDMWLHPVTDDMGNTVHVLQVYQAGAWVTVEDQDAKQIAAGAKASADAATQTAALAKTTAEQAANGAVDVTRLAADSNSTVKESVVGKLWDVIRAKLVAAKQIITEDMLATGSVTAAKITASEELSAKAAKFLRITADQIEAGTLNANVEIGSAGRIVGGSEDVVIDKNGITVGNISKAPQQVLLTANNGLDIVSRGVQKLYQGTTNRPPYMSYGLETVPAKISLSSEYEDKHLTFAEIKIISSVKDNQVAYPSGLEIKATNSNLTREYQEDNEYSLRLGNSAYGYLEVYRNGKCLATFADKTVMGAYLPPFIAEDVQRNSFRSEHIIHGSHPNIPRPKDPYPGIGSLRVWEGEVEPKNMAPGDLWVEPPRICKELPFKNVYPARWEIVEAPWISIWQHPTSSNLYNWIIKGKIKRIGEPYTATSQEYVVLETNLSIQSVGTLTPLPIADSNYPDYHLGLCKIRSSGHLGCTLNRNDNMGQPSKDIPVGTVIDISSDGLHKILFS